MSNKIEICEDEYIDHCILSQRVFNALDGEKVARDLYLNQSGTDRAIDIAKSLEDLHFIVSQLEQPKPNEVALIQSAANMAVAGTPFDATSAIPSMEDYTQVSLKNLLERISQILNSFLNTVQATFNAITEFINSMLLSLKEYKAVIEQMHKNFPLPDNSLDDIQTTVTIEPRDSMCLTLTECINGELQSTFANTLGDLLNAFNVTVKGLKDFNKIVTIANPRLSKTVREIIPTSAVTTIDQLMSSSTSANKAAFIEINDIWNKNIIPSTLVPRGMTDGIDSLSTPVLLGGYVFGFDYKPSIGKLSESIEDTFKRAEAIQSFAVSAQASKVINVDGQKVVMSGVDNITLRSFIIKLKDFITDLEKHASWCAITADMAKTQCMADITRIDKYFSELPSDSNSAVVISTNDSTPMVDDSYRNIYLSYITDINSIVKAISAMTTKPLRYGNDLVGGLVTALDSLGNRVPKGNYNLPKTVPV